MIFSTETKTLQKSETKIHFISIRFRILYLLSIFLIRISQGVMTTIKLANSRFIRLMLCDPNINHEKTNKQTDKI